LTGGYSLRRAFWRGGVGSDAQCRVNVGQAVCVSPNHCNPQALAVELMSKGSANTATGAGNENNGLHGMPCETGVNK
jgi:hypothetical protein